MTRECLGRRIESIEVLESELKVWNDSYSKRPTPINWQLNAEETRIKLKSLYSDIERIHKERDERQLAK